MAVYRIADAGFAQLKKFLEGIGISGVAESMFTAGLAALWAINGWWLGRRHEKEKEQKSARVASEKIARSSELHAYGGVGRFLSRAAA